MMNNTDLLKTIQEIAKMSAHPITQYGCETRQDFMRHLDKILEITRDVLVSLKTHEVTVQEVVQQLLEHPTNLNIRVDCYDRGVFRGTSTELEIEVKELDNGDEAVVISVNY